MHPLLLGLIFQLTQRPTSAPLWHHLDPLADVDAATGKDKYISNRVQAALDLQKYLVP